MNQHLFSYGTLRSPAVQLATFGRLVAGIDDAVVGYRVQRVRITDAAVVAASSLDVHPILVPTGDPADEVAGSRFEISDDDLAAADRYEVAAYTRVEVPLRSGLAAWVYVLAEATDAGTAP